MLATFRPQKWAVALAGATCIAMSLSTPAEAMTFAGTTAGQPTWNRPITNGPNPPTVLSSLGTDVSFSVFEFTVSATGVYNFLSEATNPVNWDNYTFLYRNSFNPSTPFANVMIGNDDFPTIGRSGFDDVALDVGTTYFLVTTGFTNNDAGVFTNSIIGSGSVTPIPTPALLPGLVALGWGALNKRKQQAQETAEV